MWYSVALLIRFKTMSLLSVSENMRNTRRMAISFRGYLD